MSVRRRRLGLALGLSLNTALGLAGGGGGGSYSLGVIAAGRQDVANLNQDGATGPRNDLPRLNPFDNPDEFAANGGTIIAADTGHGTLIELGDGVWGDPDGFLGSWDFDNCVFRDGPMSPTLQVYDALFHCQTRLSHILSLGLGNVYATSVPKTKIKWCEFDGAADAPGLKTVQIAGGKVADGSGEFDFELGHNRFKNAPAHDLDCGKGGAALAPLAWIYRNCWSPFGNNNSENIHINRMEFQSLRGGSIIEFNLGDNEGGNNVWPSGGGPSDSLMALYCNTEDMGTDANPVIVRGNVNGGTIGIGAPCSIIGQANFGFRSAVRFEGNVLSPGSGGVHANIGVAVHYTGTGNVDNDTGLPIRDLNNPGIVGEATQVVWNADDVQEGHEVSPDGLTVERTGSPAGVGLELALLQRMGFQIPETGKHWVHLKYNYAIAGSAAIYGIATAYHPPTYRLGAARDDGFGIRDNGVVYMRSPQTYATGSGELLNALESPGSYAGTKHVIIVIDRDTVIVDPEGPDRRGLAAGKGAGLLWSGAPDAAETTDPTTATDMADISYMRTDDAWFIAVQTFNVGDKWEVGDGLADEIADDVAGLDASGFNQLGAAAPPVEDTTPTAFTFTDVTGADLSTPYTSNTITVAGLGSGVSAPISITGGTYSKNGGAFVSTAGTVVNGDTVEVKATSSADASTAASAVLTIGGVSDTYTVTTAAAPVSPALVWDAAKSDASQELSNGGKTTTRSVATGADYRNALSLQALTGKGFACLNLSYAGGHVRGGFAKAGVDMGPGAQLGYGDDHAVGFYDQGGTFTGPSSSPGNVGNTGAGDWAWADDHPFFADQPKRMIAVWDEPNGLVCWGTCGDPLNGSGGYSGDGSGTCDPTQATPANRHMVNIAYMGAGDLWLVGVTDTNPTSWTFADGSGHDAAQIAALIASGYTQWGA